MYLSVIRTADGKVTVLSDFILLNCHGSNHILFLGGITIENYYVIFRYLVICGPVRREDAIEFAKKMRADSLERRLRNTGINPHNCTAEQKDLLKAIIASNKTDFKVLQEKQCVEEYPDAYEYFIVRDIFARTKK